MLDSGILTAIHLHFHRIFTPSIPQGRDTSESDLFLIGFGPYEDTLSRLDGGKDHNIKAQKISAEKVI